jgi:hypothetical protein
VTAPESVKHPGGTVDIAIELSPNSADKKFEGELDGRSWIIVFFNLLDAVLQQRCLGG